MPKNKTENEKKMETFLECSRCNRPMEKKNMKFMVGGEEHCVPMANRNCPACEIVAQAEDSYRQEQKVFSERILKSRLSKRQLEYSFTQFKPEQGTRAAFRAAQNYTLSEKGLFFFGERCGIGKTHLMAALARRLMQEKNDVLWIHLPKFLNQLRQKIDGDVSLEDVSMRQALRAPILFIDDLGAERETAWAAETLLIVLNERWEEKRTTFLTSNLDLAQLDKILGRRIVSRIADMCLVFGMAGTDHRTLPPT